MRKTMCVAAAAFIIAGLSVVSIAKAAEEGTWHFMNLFINGEEASDDIVEINGKKYVPLQVVLDETNARTFHNSRTDDFHIIYSGNNLNASRKTSSQSPNQGSAGYQGNPYATPYPEDQPYHAGMVRADLENLLQLVEDIEDLSTDFQTVIYSHLNGIQNAKTIDRVEAKFQRLEDHYDELADRYDDMASEADDLVGYTNDVDDLEDDLADDMEDILRDKEDALEYLEDWLNGNDEDDFEDYEDQDEDANDLISDVKNYVEGSIEDVKNETDDYISN